MTKSRTITAAAALLISCGLTATSASAQNPDSARAGNADACVGLSCEQPNSAHGVPEAQGMMARVAGPSELHQQRVGFYEFGRGTLAGNRAVAYVIPKGSSAAAPASIQRLPSYQALASVNAFERGTTVIFAPTVSEFAAEDQIGTLAYSDCPGGTTWRNDLHLGGPRLPGPHAAVLEHGLLAEPRQLWVQRQRRLNRQQARWGFAAR